MPAIIPRGQTPERRAYMKAYNNSHPKRDRRAYKSEYDRTHKNQIAEYVAANREHVSKRAASYYRANRSRILQRVKVHADANRERILAYQAAYYAANTERVKATVKAYREANPEKKWHLENKRRACKASNGGSHTLDELLDKFARLGNVCFYCGRGGKLTIDHDMPISRGGRDDIGNILPACRSCNSRKRARTGQEFIAAIGGVGR